MGDPHALVDEVVHREGRDADLGAPRRDYKSNVCVCVCVCRCARARNAAQCDAVGKALSLSCGGRGKSVEVGGTYT